jgi:DNA-binding NtrC family response regulator
MQDHRVPPPSRPSGRSGLRRKVDAGAAVLVVEDDLELGALLADLLSDAGYVPSHVPSAERAFERLEAQPFDLVLTDVHLSGVADGLSVLYAVRRIGHRTPVVVMTAFGSPGLARRALADGAAACLSKPVRMSDLLECVERCLDGRHVPGRDAAG